MLLETANRENMPKGDATTIHYVTLHYQVQLLQPSWQVVRPPCFLSVFLSFFLIFFLSFFRVLLSSVLAFCLSFFSFSTCLVLVSLFLSFLSFLPSFSPSLSDSIFSLSLCLSTCLSLSIYLSISVYLSTYPSVYLSATDLAKSALEVNTLSPHQAKGLRCLARPTESLLLPNPREPFRSFPALTPAPLFFRARWTALAALRGGLGWRANTTSTRHSHCQRRARACVFALRAAGDEGLPGWRYYALVLRAGTMRALCAAPQGKLSVLHTLLCPPVSAVLALIQARGPGAKDVNGQQHITQDGCGTILPRCSRLIA